MAFDTFTDFLAMGGHARYVWLAYGITAVSLGLLVWLSLRGQRRWLSQQRQQLNARASRPSAQFREH